jgi:hypothetical protein
MPPDPKTRRGCDCRLSTIQDVPQRIEQVLWHVRARDQAQILPGRGPVAAAGRRWRAQLPLEPGHRQPLGLQFVAQDPLAQRLHAGIADAERLGQPAGGTQGADDRSPRLPAGMA